MFCGAKARNSCKNALKVILLDGKGCFFDSEHMIQFQVNIFSNKRDMSKVEACVLKANTNAMADTDDTRVMTVPRILVPKARANNLREKENS